jgi:hypothetical protein
LLSFAYDLISVLAAGWQMESTDRMANFMNENGN